MVLDIDNFSLNIDYDRKEDSLSMVADRSLKNSEVLLVLVHLLSLIEPEHRNDIIDLAVASLEQRAMDNAN